MEDTSIPSLGSETTSRWNIFGNRVPKEEIVFISQVVLIYIVCITCIVNLSLGIENKSLWASLLSGGLGYILPSPTLKKNSHNGSFLPNTAE